jgi:hypothetical protein
MTDGLGGTVYSYDSLSRLASETRTIDDSETSYEDDFTFNYTYTLGGQLKTFSDPDDTTRNVSYTYDKLGRATAVGGNGYGGVYTYAGDLTYRAFGSLKSMEYGSGKTVTQEFDNRLQLSEFQIEDMMDTSNEYYPDGSTKFVGNNTEGQEKFDRLNRYDHAGRITKANSGLEARDEKEETNDRPYRQTYEWNSFGNLTGRAGLLWNQEAEGFSGLSFSNNRRNFASYDNDGRMVEDNVSGMQSSFDASGRLYKTVKPAPRYAWQGQVEKGFDGDGVMIKTKEGSTVKRYNVRSSVLGVIYELSKFESTYIKGVGVTYLNGEELAVQIGNSVIWIYEHPITNARRGHTFAYASEPDPMGVNAGLFAPLEDPMDTGVSSLVLPARFVDAFDLSGGCESDGGPIACDRIPGLDESIGDVHVDNSTGAPRQGVYPGGGMYQALGEVALSTTYGPTKVGNWSVKVTQNGNSPDNYWSDYYYEWDVVGYNGIRRLLWASSPEKTNIPPVVVLPLEPIEFEPPDPCPGYIAKILAAMKLFDKDFLKFDAVRDAIGGERMKWGSGFTKPGGHRKELKDIQNRIRNNIRKFNHNKCPGEIPEYDWKYNIRPHLGFPTADDYKLGPAGAPLPPPWWVWVFPE